MCEEKKCRYAANFNAYSYTFILAFLTNGYLWYIMGYSAQNYPERSPRSFNTSALSDSFSFSSSAILLIARRYAEFISVILSNPLQMMYYQTQALRILSDYCLPDRPVLWQIRQTVAF